MISAQTRSAFAARKPLHADASVQEARFRRNAAKDTHSGHDCPELLQL